MPNRILIPLIVACALFMETLDSTVLSTALPAIAIDFDDSPIRLKLAMTTYLLTMAIGIPASGWIADRFGTRTIFRLALLLFTVGSILCGLSSSIWEIVGARIVQGIGGSMMVPVGRLVLLRAVPKSEMVSALAWLTVPALIGPAVGPPLGGFITTYFEWRWIFWINVPVGVLGIVLATIFMPDIRGEERQRFDAAGFALAAFGLAAFVSGSTMLGVGLLPLPAIAAMIAVGAVALVVYAVRSRHISMPILDLQLFRIPTFRIAILGGTLFRFGMGATPFLLPLLFQLTFDMTAFSSGLMTFAVAFGAMAMKFIAQPILKQFGFRTVLIWNCLIASGFILTYGLMRPSMSLAFVFLIIFVSGFFRSLQATGLNALVFADVPPQMMSRATTLAAVAQQIALSMGISIGAIALTYVSAGDVDTLTAADFLLPFAVIAFLAASGVWFYWQLSGDAGSEVSGRQSVAAPATAPTGQA